MKTFTRREFIKSSALAGAGLTIALTITPYGYRILKAGEARGDPAFRPSAWIQVTPDNKVQVFINKSEMGQGVSTSLPMVVADELEAAWEQVSFRESPAGPEYVDPVSKMQLTGGSTSVRHMYKPLRAAGASARQMLVAAAAKTWSVPEEECVAAQGTVKHKTTGRSLTYGQLAETASGLPVPANPQLKKESEFRYIGKSIPRLDIPDKVNGKTVYGIDITVAGMLYASIERPPAYGAKPLSWNKKAAAGVMKIIPISTGVAVVARSITAAWNGRKALNVKWGKGARPDLDNASLDKDFLAALDKKGLTALDRGSAADAISRSPEKVESDYFLPYLAHVTMEPMDSTAHVRPEGCDIWTPTQNQTGVVKLAVKITGLKPEQIRVHTTFLGGGFGRRGDVGYAGEAVEISKKAGVPVKLIWTRQEDIKFDTYRPGSSCRITGALDAKGNLIAWSHKVAVPSLMEHFAPERMKNGLDPTAYSGIVDMDYEIPNLHVEWVRIQNPIPVGFWRSVGNSQNAFTMESFMDELAHAAGRDPLEFRLALLKDHLPATRLLETVAEKSGWGKPPKKGQALGLSYHFAYGSRVAQVAEVSVDKGKVNIHRVVCAIDCGPVVVNPAIIAQQANSAITMGLSAALRERVNFDKGGAATSNFNDYHELRISGAPEAIEVHVLRNQPDMGGIGEPSLPPAAPALANAIFSATGKRIRRLPIEPELQNA